MPYRNEIATKSCIQSIYNLRDFAKHAGPPNGGLNRFFTMPIENSSRGAVAGAVNRRRQ